MVKFSPGKRYTWMYHVKYHFRELRILVQVPKVSDFFALLFELFLGVVAHLEKEKSSRTRDKRAHDTA